jgi:hypothetical protein
MKVTTITTKQAETMKMISHNNLIRHQQTMPIITRKGNRLNRGLLNMPNEPNFQPNLLKLSAVIAGDYNEKNNLLTQKSKPNPNPIQTQYKPKPKPNQTHSKPNLPPNFDDACKTVYLRKRLLSSCKQHHLYGFLVRHAYILEYNVLHSLAALL